MADPFLSGVRSPEKVPVTILTGFLGSGKTTLLNHILTATHGKKIAIIENEFGDVGIDDKLLESNAKMQSEEELIEMMNGCICCTVRQDLVKVIHKLAERCQAGLKLDGIVIETTGMADPAPVAQTFFVDERTSAFARLDGIVTLVDAKHVEQHLDEDKGEGVENEAVEQVAFADRLLLNKVDLVSEEDLKRVETRLRSINKLAPILQCERSKVSVEQVLNIKGFDLDRTLEMDPGFLSTEGAEHEHDDTVTSVSIVQNCEVELEQVEKFISYLLREKGADLYRMKGVLAVAHAVEKFVYHSVHMLFSGDFVEPWGPEEERSCKMVFIGKNLDEDDIKQRFKKCLASGEKDAARRQALRFSVGDRVECAVNNCWAPGTVIAHMYRDDGMPPGLLAPYQVKIDGGAAVYVPADSVHLIRELKDLPAWEEK
jgi:G3E family GTPase